MDKITKNSLLWLIIMIFVITGILLYGLYGYAKHMSLKEHIDTDNKDSIQKHLVWSVRGECFFVLPTKGEHVKLIPVEDCNKK